MKAASPRHCSRYAASSPNGLTAPARPTRCAPVLATAQDGPEERRRTLLPRKARRAPGPPAPEEGPSSSGRSNLGRPAPEGAATDTRGPGRSWGGRSGDSRRPGGDRRDRRDRQEGGDDTDWVPPPPDPALARTPRYLALQQLLRVEQEGAYVGLVSGSAAGAGAGAGRRAAPPGAEDPDADVEAEAGLAAGGGGGEEAAAGGGRRGGGGGGGGLSALEPRDRRLVKELVAGVTRLQRRLDFVASKLSEQSPSEWEPGVRMVLRLGLFELTERRLPPHALNEHVRLAKAVARPAAAPFVNGVLRAAARRREADTLPLPEAEPAPAQGKPAVRHLAIRHSHPTWLVSRWLPRFGPDATAQLLQHNNTPPMYSLRLNPLWRGGAGGGGGGAAAVRRLVAELCELGVDAEVSPYLPGEFFRVRSGLQKLLEQGYVSSGRVAVQDESAGLVVALLDPQPGERLLDCCAAPGGKTLFAAARMGGRGSITALDVSAGRLRALGRAAELAGAGHMVVPHAADLRDWAAAVAAGEVVPEHADADADADARGGGGLGAEGSARDRWQNEDDEGEEEEEEEARGRGPRGGGSWSVAEPSAPGLSLLAGAARRRSAAPRPPRPATAAHLYDKVLLDAPCTGTGVLSKRADLRWRRTPEDLQQLGTLQDQLLDSVAALVAPGGVLVYSTCSIEPEEDAERVAAFLQRHRNFEVHPAEGVEEAERAPGGARAASGAAGGGEGGRVLLPAAVVTAQGFMATLPHVHGTDGAFGARLRRVR